MLRLSYTAETVLRREQRENRSVLCCVLSLLHQPVPLQRLKRLLCCPNCPYVKWLGWLPLSAEGLADVADFKTQQTNPSIAKLLGKQTACRTGTEVTEGQ